VKEAAGCGGVERKAAGPSEGEGVVLCAEGRFAMGVVVKDNWNIVLKTKLRGGNALLTQGNKKQHTAHTRGGGGAMRRFEGGVGFGGRKTVQKLPQSEGLE
jgi:hypothetical protein